MAHEWLSFDIGFWLVALVAVAGGLLTGMVTSIAKQWRRVRVAEMEATLKQQMIERGMSAAEIERVLRATRDGAMAELVREC